MNELKHFHVYRISEEFYSITNWEDYKVHIKSNRPNLILVIEYEEYPDSVLCIPISKDDDKKRKYYNIMKRYKNNVHPLDFNQYDNYALIQNSFFLNKRFVDGIFTVNGVHVEVIDNNTQSDIMQKFESLYAIYKHRGPLPIQVDYDVVYSIQKEYISQSL